MILCRNLWQAPGDSKIIAPERWKQEDLAIRGFRRASESLSVPDPIQLSHRKSRPDRSFVQSAIFGVHPESIRKLRLLKRQQEQEKRRLLSRSDHAENLLLNRAELLHR